MNVIYRNVHGVRKAGVAAGVGKTQLSNRSKSTGRTWYQETGNGQAMSKQHKLGKARIRKPEH